MNKNDGQKSKKLDNLVKVGIGIFIIGSGPLLITMLLASLGLTSDPNPNPVGFGIMAFFTFWPSLILMIAGLVKTFKAKKS